MSTHYPSNYSKSLMIAQGVESAYPANSLCDAGKRGGFRASVDVSLRIENIDCKRCLKMLKSQGVIKR